MENIKDSVVVKWFVDEVYSILVFNFPKNAFNFRL